MKSSFPVARLCEAFEVSPSGFYHWQHRQHHPTPRAQNDAQLEQHIARIHRDSHATYGSPRICHLLRRQGHRHGRKRIARLMRRGGLVGRPRRRFRPRATDSRHGHPIAPNRLLEAPPPTRPNEVWVTDITYLPTVQGWMYLAVVMDLASRRVVGWAFSFSLASTLVLAALRMAIDQREPSPGLVVHSDRGVQFAGAEFRNLLGQHHLLASMSRRAHCYDNAAMEAFFSSLKIELVYRHSHLDAAQLSSAVFEYIEGFYNRQRLHSALGFVSPAEYEQRLYGST